MLVHSVPSARTGRIAAAAMTASLLAAALLLTGCGKGKEEAGKEATKASAATACVSCHTDREKLKVETADIVQPAGSALQSGKG